MEEIVDGIFTWSWFSEPHGYDFNGHLVRHPDGNLCIDPVEPSPGILDTIAREGATRIVLTNRNHSRASNVLRTQTGARVVIHPDDAAHARDQGTEIDDEITVGGSIASFEVISAAGKSPGEIALFWPARRILIVGDAIVGDPPGACKLLPEMVIDDLPRLRSSVRALCDLDFDTLLVGDGVPILTDARAQVRRLVDSFPA